MTSNPAIIKRIAQETYRRMSSNYPGSGTVHAIDGDTVDVKAGGSSAVFRNVTVVGDATKLSVGQTVALTWVEVPGSATPQPIVLAQGINGSTLQAPSSNIKADEVTITNGAAGLSVKLGSITMAHLQFQPSIEGHTHSDLMSLGGWQVLPDGTLFNGTTFIYPNGQISLGTGNNVIKLDSLDPLYRIWAGNVNPASAPFSVQKDGKLFLGNPSGQYLQWNGSALLIKGTAQSTDFVTGLSGWQINSSGNAEFSNVTVRGTLKSTTFIKGEISVIGGTVIIAKNASTLTADIVVPGTGTWSMTVKGTSGAPFAASDIIRIKDLAIGDTWFTVGAATDNGNDTYTYTCTWGYGTLSVTYRAGSPVLDYGVSGNGFLYLSSDDANGMMYSIRTHAGAPWTTVTEQLRLGDMYNAYGAGANHRYGIGIGDYAGGNYLSYNAETAGGFVNKSGGGNVTLNADGIAIVQSTSGNYSRLKWTTGGATFAEVYAYDNIEQCLMLKSTKPGGAPIIVLRTNDGNSTGDLQLWTSYFQIGVPITIADLAAPGTPASGYGALYVNSDHLYFKNDAGGQRRLDLDADQVDWTDYSTTSTVTGWSSFTTKKIYYKKVGKLVFVQYRLEGTSNSAGASFSLPYAANSNIDLYDLVYGADNGTQITALLGLYTSGTSVYFYATLTGGAWTSSGTKCVRGEFWYQTA